MNQRSEICEKTSAGDFLRQDNTINHFRAMRKSKTEKTSFLWIMSIYYVNFFMSTTRFCGHDTIFSPSSDADLLITDVLFRRLAVVFLHNRVITARYIVRLDRALYVPYYLFVESDETGRQSSRRPVHTLMYAVSSFLACRRAIPPLRRRTGWRTAGGYSPAPRTARRRPPLRR